MSKLKVGDKVTVPKDAKLNYSFMFFDERYFQITDNSHPVKEETVFEVREVMEVTTLVESAWVAVVVLPNDKDHFPLHQKIKQEHLVKVEG